MSCCRFNTAASEIAGVAERLQIQLKHLEAGPPRRVPWHPAPVPNQRPSCPLSPSPPPLPPEIAADRGGVYEFNAALRRLAIEKEDTQARLRRNEVWARNFDEKIKPFEAT